MRFEEFSNTKHLKKEFALVLPQSRVGTVKFGEIHFQLGTGASIRKIQFKDKFMLAGRVLRRHTHDSMAVYCGARWAAPKSAQVSAPLVPKQG